MTITDDQIRRATVKVFLKPFIKECTESPGLCLKIPCDVVDSIPASWTHLIEPVLNKHRIVQAPNHPGHWEYR